MKQYHPKKLPSKKVTTIVEVTGKREAVIYRLLLLSCARGGQLYSLLHAPTAVVLSNTIKGASCISKYYIDISMKLIHLQEVMCN